jgi:nickel/cobalt transporter (NicO) family protein
MRKRPMSSVGLALSFLLMVGVHLSPAIAQSQPAAPSNSQAAPAAPQAASKSFLPSRVTPSGIEVQSPPSGPLAGLYFWIGQQQRQFISSLAAALRDIKAGNVWAASLVLIGFSFAYGVLHAAGPGHGKAIVSSYMLADGQTVRRGVQLAFLSSLVQAVSALVLFSVVVLLLKGARTQITNTEAWLERASWAIVAGFGAWLLIRQLRALVSGKPVHAHDHDHAYDHEHRRSHGHDHGHAHAAVAHAHHGHNHAHKHQHGPSHTAANQSHQANHGHSHAVGEACDTCGHAHMPTADTLQGSWSWRRAATMAFAIGLRPCTGAIGVLFVANGLGLMWAGVISTFVMAIGTAITVSALAILAAGSRDLATRIAGTADNSWASRAQTAIGLAGAALVFVLGSTFFYYSWTTTTPF